MKVSGLYSGNIRAVVARGLIMTRKQSFGIVFSGIVEPIFYLLAMGVGMGELMGSVTGPGGQPISYAAYIAPALLATAAMNGAVYDSTWGVFFKVNYSKLYQTMLQTSLGPLDVALGEIFMALLRGMLYALSFMVFLVAMGLATSWWAVLMVPSALLIALGFASFGMGVTSFLKTFQQMDLINFIMLPMFLLSATFYPITVYPKAVQWIIEVMPLWHGVEMMRQLSVGHVTTVTGAHAIYFVAMTVLGTWLTASRLRALFLN
ncbi:ABC transporter permease [Cutibacterium equinum]|uniref:Transport permease protein n=1 Tax=Cutibacterium equinum TaxID=3016342 RepID=A0ABY7QZ45_9ACTN|nr:ABC transporter permease [Cutibacterium equinum]WCC80306.1 ABC transporter permease [Cutibacterium equinum]